MIDTLKGLARLGLSYAPDFHGRATRTQLGITYITCGIAGVIMTGISTALGPSLPPLAAAQTTIGIALTVLPIAAVCVRRLHDTNRGGLELLRLLIPYVGILVVGFLLLQGGYEGENETGPDPRNRRKW